LLAVCSPVISSWGKEPLNRGDQIAYQQSLQYKRLLVGYSGIHWGSGKAPIPLLAAQVHQESRWRPGARSKYACGLTQFTPETADWISATYRTHVGTGNCLDPAWALRAQAAYMRYLETRKYTEGISKCDVWRFSLWAYNGGGGWVIRDKNLAAKRGSNPLSARDVQTVNAGRAIEFFKENRMYDVGIIMKWQPHYLGWGGEATCPGETISVPKLVNYNKPNDIATAAGSRANARSKDSGTKNKFIEGIGNV
jgi:soluble lytic murein transglycosylase-like protein